MEPPKPMSRFKLAYYSSTLCISDYWKVSKLFVISASAPVLAMQIADANRPLADDSDDKSSDGMATVGRAVRLDNRWLDLRAYANHAIFRLQSAGLDIFPLSSSIH
jgi:hypothetical protein